MLFFLLKVNFHELSFAILLNLVYYSKHTYSIHLEQADIKCSSQGHNVVLLHGSAPGGFEPTVQSYCFNHWTNSTFWQCFLSRAFL